MALNPGHLFWGLLWLIMFVVTLSVNLFRFPSYEEVQCKMLSNTNFSVDTLPHSNPNAEKYCVVRANVSFTHHNETATAKARTKPILCEPNHTLCKAKHILCKKKPAPLRDCWLSESGQVFIPVDQEDAEDYEQAARVFRRLRVAFIVFAAFFALFFIYIVVRSCDPHIFSHCRSTFSIHGANTVSDNGAYLRPPSSTFSLPVQNDVVVPNSTLQYRISLFIQQFALTPRQVKALAEEQWTCCICLEQIPDTARLPHIVRLRCSHAIHTECFRMWISKGRAVCCICNAPVFSDSLVDGNDSHAPSSPSVLDSRPPDSLLVEITEYSTSSPSTSDVMQPSQPQSDTNSAPPHSAQRDEPTTSL